MTCYSGFAPLFPFMPTILKQRGYSAFIVGLIFMLLPFPGLLGRPLVGAITDKYKCRRSAFILCTIMIFLMVFALMLIPGTAVAEEIDDAVVLKSPLFWLFFSTITAIITLELVRIVLEDTICMDLLGTHTFC